jgi:hypothetical protein
MPPNRRRISRGEKRKFDRGDWFNFWASGSELDSLDDEDEAKDVLAGTRLDRMFGSAMSWRYQSVLDIRRSLIAVLRMADQSEAGKGACITTFTSLLSTRSLNLHVMT